MPLPQAPGEEVAPGLISSSLPGHLASTMPQQHVAALAVGSCQEALLGHATAKSSAGVLSPTLIWGHISQKGLPELASGRDTTQGSTLPHCPPDLRSPCA